MKAQIDEIACDLFRYGKPWPVGDTEGESECSEQIEGFSAEPGGISELEGVAKGFGTGQGGEKDAKLLKPFLVEAESWRELP